MKDVLLWLFVGMVGYLLSTGMTRPGRIYEAPFMVGVIALAFILPQMPGLASERFLLPAGAFEKTTIFTILCLAAVRLGWWSSMPALKALNWVLEERRLLWAAAILSGVGSAFYYQLSRQGGELAVYTGYTGVPVMQLFFAKTLTYGLGIAVLCFARRPSLPALAIAVFDTGFYVDRVFVTGKRGDLTEFLLIIALSAWFSRRIAVPRPLALAAVAVGTLAMGSVHQYREITRTHDRPTWEEISRLQPLENFYELLSSGPVEMRNAAVLIANTDHSLQFDFGTYNWNILVHNFVPRRIVGSVLKEALYVDLVADTPRGYVPPTGSTETGMADAFRSFWWFGWIKFLFYTIVLCRLYRAAIAGSAVAQIVYMFSLVPFALVFSHLSQFLLSAWIHMVMFLLPALLLARHPTRRVHLQTAA